MNYFMATNSNQQGQTFSYTTPTSSGYYCAESTLYLSNVSIDSDSVCFNFTFDDDSDGVLNGNDL